MYMKIIAQIFERCNSAEPYRIFFQRFPKEIAFIYKTDYLSVSLFLKETLKIFSENSFYFDLKSEFPSENVIFFSKSEYFV